jgi:hypothetical protein
MMSKCQQVDKSWHQLDPNNQTDRTTKRGHTCQTSPLVASLSTSYSSPFPIVWSNGQRRHGWKMRPGKHADIVKRNLKSTTRNRRSAEPRCRSITSSFYLPSLVLPLVEVYMETWKNGKGRPDVTICSTRVLHEGFSAEG